MSAARHVAARRPRFDPDRARRREITERFLVACASGDVDRLTSLLARDVLCAPAGAARR